MNQQIPTDSLLVIWKRPKFCQGNNLNIRIKQSSQHLLQVTKNKLDSIETLLKKTICLNEWICGQTFTSPLIKIKTLSQHLCTHLLILDRHMNFLCKFYCLLLVDISILLTCRYPACRMDLFKCYKLKFIYFIFYNFTKQQ